MKELIKQLREAGKLEAEIADQLLEGVEKLDNKLSKAMSESIERRKKLKELDAQLKSEKEKTVSILEQLGMDADEDLDLDAIVKTTQGQVEQTKQLEAKLKRLEREKQAAEKARLELENKVKDSQKQQALTEALGKFEFVDADVVKRYFERDVEVTDDGVFVGDVPLHDAITTFANEKPHLLKAQGRPGSGHTPASGRSTKNPFSKEHFNLTEQARLMKENPELAKKLKSQAS